MSTAANQKRTWETKRLKITTLKPHPLQDYYYAHTTTPSDDETLREDLARNGQRDPIHVLGKNNAELPAGTVLDGWRRARALEANGEKEIDAIIRHDLATADRTAVDAEFLQFNVGRRQLHQLDRARVALGLYRLEKGRSGKLRDDEEREARDRVAKVVGGMSGRTLQRYFCLLSAPLEVQLAVRDGRLRLIDGERVSRLCQEKQAEIAERICGGEAPKIVVAEFLASRPRRPAYHGCSDLIGALRRGLNSLKGRVHEIAPHTLRTEVELLERGKHLIEHLMARAQDPDEDYSTYIDDDGYYDTDDNNDMDEDVTEDP